MATKVFCDACGGDMTDQPWKLAEVPLTKNFPNVVSCWMHKAADNWTEDFKPDVCKCCIIDAFKKLDDRPATHPDSLINPHAAKFVVHPETGKWLKSNNVDLSTVPVPELDDRLRVKLAEPMGQQMVPIELTEQVIDGAAHQVAVRGGKRHDRIDYQRWWAEVLLLLRSN